MYTWWIQMWAKKRIGTYTVVQCEARDNHKMIVISGTYYANLPNIDKIDPWPGTRLLLMATQ